MISEYADVQGLGDANERLCRSEERAEHCAEILKAVAHPIRLRIVALLSGGMQHVSGIAKELDIAQAIVSQQLRILRMRGLVKVARSSGYAYYSLRENQLSELVRCIDGCS